MALAVLSEVVLEQEVEDCIVLADIGAVLFLNFQRFLYLAK